MCVAFVVLVSKVLEDASCTRSRAARTGERVPRDNSDDAFIVSTRPRASELFMRSEG
jgi:hypothetical protein